MNLLEVTTAREFLAALQAQPRLMVPAPEVCGQPFGPVIQGMMDTRVAEGHHCLWCWSPSSVALVADCRPQDDQPYWLDLCPHCYESVLAMGNHIELPSDPS